MQKFVNRPNCFEDITIFRFSLFPPFTDQVENDYLHCETKFHQNRSNGYGDIKFNVFSKRRLSAILEFFKVIF